MRYLRLALGWYLDLLVYLACRSLLGALWSPMTGVLIPDGPWRLLVDLAIFAVLRVAISLLVMTPGQWMLDPAMRERQDAAAPANRQWPNLLAGTLLFLEGTKSMVRWLEMDYPIPFMGHVPQGLEQGLIGIGMGILFMAGGIALLRMSPLGRVVGFAALGVTAISTIASWTVWDTVIARMAVARRAAQGLPVRDGEIAFMQDLFPEGIVVALVLCAALLLFCRSRQS